ncbi:MAG: amino acid adenylation domain-containing protein [Cytophagales bacterium]|nr:amino acid adenylation domain-containing protein [Cytophagales bacterium]
MPLEKNPLTGNQKAIWLEEQLYPNTAVYNIGGYNHVKGRLESVRFRKAAQQFFAENDAFRTQIRLFEEEPYQVFLPEIEIPIDEVDFSDRDDPFAVALDFMKDDFKKPFDLTSSNLLFHYLLLHLGPNESIWYIRAHHIMLDGWAISLMVNRVSDIYTAMKEDESYTSDKIFSFQEFIYEDIKYEKSEQFAAARSFWKNKIFPLPDSLLPSPEGVYQPGVAPKETIFIDRKKYARVIEACTEHKVSEFHFFLATIFLYFSKIYQKYDWVIGIPILNRGNFAEKNTSGLFTGISPLRLQVEPGQNLLDLMNLIKSELRQNYRYQRFPFNEIQKDIKSHATELEGNLIDITFSFEKHRYTPTIDGSPSRIIPLSGGVGAMPLTFFIRDYQDDEEIAFDLSYNKQYVEVDQVRQILGHLNHLIDTLPDSLDTSISEIAHLPKADRHLLLETFNETEKPFPGDQTFVDAFQAQASLSPKNTAVFFRDQSWTYGTLNAHANRLCHYLQELEIGPGDFVGVCMDRSYELLVGILGVLKSGAAFVPMDASKQGDRLSSVIEDASLELLLTQSHLVGQLNVANLDLLMLDEGEITDDWLEGYESTDPESSIDPSEVAYVIYTSGSTGRPKGCVLQHQNLRNYLNWASDYYFNDGVAGNFGLFTSISFDLTLTSIFSPLSRGKSLSIFPMDTGVDEILGAVFSADTPIDTVKLTPTHISLIPEMKESNVRVVITGGEQLKRTHTSKLWSINPDLCIENEYGPTETTIGCIAGPVSSEGLIDIGKPIDNTRIYILNQHRELVPVGMDGEICIAGIGVGAGYLNQEEITNQRFVESPFVPGEKIYCSGDKGRWLPDGRIVLKGRIDDQIKIRGYRIEPGEVEHHLCTHESVLDAVVMAMPDRLGESAELFAVVVTEEEALTSTTMHLEMKHRLPDYMVPNRFSFIKQLPLTSNGKTDKRALAELYANLDSDSVELELPATQEEQVLLDICRSVLNHAHIGISDHFFHIGGDSIKAIQIKSKLQNKQYEIGLREIFDFPVLRDLAKQMRTLQRVPDQSLIQGAAPLTPIQKEFFSWKLTAAHHYNQSVWLDIPEGIDFEGLQLMLNHLLTHHDGLRLVFDGDSQVNGGIEHPFVLEWIDLKKETEHQTTEEIEAKVHALQQSIDLKNGPLIKAAVFETDEDRRLLMVVHHLIVDLVSWRILTQDLATLYQQHHKSQSFELPLKTDAYLFWAEKLIHEISIPEKELDYWKKLEQAELDVLVPDHDSVDYLSKDTRSVSFQLSTATTEKLLFEAHHAYNTQINDLLLSALSLALASQFDVHRIILAMEGHGREAIPDEVDVSRTVGWFTSIFPVVLEATSKSEDRSHHQLITTKEMLRNIPNHGVHYNILKWNENHAFETKLTPQISFNFFGQLDNESGDFRILSAAAGSQSIHNQCQYELDVSGFISDNQLALTISYCKARFDQETMQSLMQSYQQHLEDLITFCVSVDQQVATPSDYTFSQLSYDQLEMVNHQFTGEVEDIYSLTPLQEGILFHELYEPSAGAYFGQMSYKLKGDLNLERVEWAYNVLMQRHEALRAGFIFKDFDQPLQVIARSRNIEFKFRNLIDEGVTIEEQSQVITRYKQEDQRRGFDLASDVLMRIMVFACSNQTYQVVWSHHHIITDGWSNALLMKEWIAIYQEGFVDSLPEVKPFKTHLRWLEQNEADLALGYWEAYLKDYRQHLTIPGKKPLNSEQYDNRKYELTLSDSVTAELKKVAADHHVSLNTVMQTLWGVLLTRYNLVNDVVFGAVVSGRPPELEGAQEMVGLFINTVPVRINFGKEDTLEELLLQVQEKSLSSTPYHYTALSEIQQRSEMGNALIDQILIFENYPIEDQLFKALAGTSDKQTSAGFTLDGHFEFLEQTNYDLNLVMIPSDQLTIQFKYNGACFEEKDIEQVARNLEYLVTGVSGILRFPVHNIPIITTKDETLLKSFNGRLADYPVDQTLVALFEKQVAQSPEAIAVVAGETSLTYRSLNEKANGLAALLINNHDILPDQVVAIMSDRSEVEIIGLLGILKAGGAYLPIDPNTPERRLEYILDDSEAKLLLTDKIMPEKLDRMVNIPQVTIQPQLFNEPQNPTKKIGADNLAYVIYTSGSTGKPKGVMVEHRAILNRLYWMKDEFNLTSEEVFLHNTPYTFDASLTELFMPLLVGARLCILPGGEERDLEALTLTIQEHGVTHLKVVPTMVAALNEYYQEKEQPSDLSSLKFMYTGGEAITQRQVSEFYQYIGHPYDISLINTYGPTEAAVTVAYFDCSKSEEYPYVPIGKPIANVSLYILDTSKNIQPIGSPGELCVSGINLARGYLNQAGLTEEQFINHPFEEGQKLYKTGDLARWLPDGNIEFLGRIDDQVKIRGYRIEIGEIEHSLTSYPDIKEASVQLKVEAGGEKILFAGIVANKDVIDLRELTGFLKESLPLYMIPGQFAVLDALPLTSNGKVNKQALLKMESLQNGTPIAKTSPNSRIEQQLVEIWSEVLERQPSRINVTDHFFAVGGHSLKATRVVSRIHRDMGLDISIREIFEYPTIRELAVQLSTRQSKEFLALEPIQKQANYPVSNAQRRLWILDQLEGQTGLYHMTSTFLLKGHIHVEAFSQALSALEQRHETLRTTFERIEGKPVQIVHDTVGLKLEYLDYSNESNVDELLDQVEEQDMQLPFSLSKAPLLRVKLIKLNVEKANSSKAYDFALFFNIHHIIADGWSTEVIAKELMVYYQAFVNEDSPVLPALRVQYKDYSSWQNELLEGEYANVLKNYWHEKLAGDLPELRLPYKQARNKVKSHNGTIARFLLNDEINQDLEALAQRLDVSLFMTLTAVVKVLLHRYSDQEDIIVGSAVAGREHTDLENLIGFFVNTLAIRTKIDPTQKFEAFANDIKANITGALDHQLYPFDVLVEELVEDRDRGRNPIFDVMVTLVGDKEIELPFDQVEVSQQAFSTKYSKFDLTFQFSEHKNGLQLELEYNTDLFESETIDRMFEHFVQLCGEVIKAPETTIGLLNIISAEERQVLLTDFNDTQQSVFEVMLSQIERHALENPNGLALASSEGDLTYADFNAKANQLAHYLIEQEIGSGDKVGVFMQRGPALLISLLGILKTGAAFVPLDPEQQSERLSYMVANAEIELMLVQDHLIDQLELSALDIMVLDDQILEPDWLPEYERVNPEVEIEKNSVAYVIYTSGSTGKPKGCKVSHDNLNNYVQWADQYYFGAAEHGHFPLFTPLSFDLTLTSIFCTLTRGKTLSIMDPSWSQDEVLRHCFDPASPIDAIKLTPAHISLLQGLNLTQTNIKTVIIGGDQLKSSHVDTLVALGDNLRIYNEYGPTETTIGCVASEVHQGQSITIGQPIANTYAYVLDEALNPLPIGGVGELYIGGAGVGQGYQNNEEATYGRFIDNPFAEEGRIYRTGDLASWSADGTLDCLGRKDDQVKIRGYRIELSEVEFHVQQLNQIRDNVVLAIENGEQKELHAYIVSEQAELDLIEIQNNLRQTLPEYMIPARFHEVEKIPLTPNGKADKKALLRISSVALAANDTYLAPDTLEEKLLASVWANVLKHEKVSLHDNFFYIGGDSIKAIQIASHIQEKGYELTLRDMFDHPTLKDQSYAMRKTQRVSEQGEIKGELPLTPIQSTFFEWELEDPHHFNQAVMIQLPEGIDAEALNKMFGHLQRHHDALRMVFEGTESGVRQINQGYDSPTVIDIHDFSGQSSEHWRTILDDQIHEAQSSLNLGQGPLMRLSLFEFNDAYFLLVVIHHLVVDQVSWRILAEDLATLMQQHQDGLAFNLPAKTDAFQYWANKLADYPSKLDSTGAEYDYWQQLTTRETDRLPVDHVAGSDKEEHTDEVILWLSRSLTSDLQSGAHQAYNTNINELLLTSLGKAIHDQFEVNTIGIAMEGHGRESLFDDLNVSRTVGWFTSIYPVILESGNEVEWATALVETKEMLRKIPNHGVGFGILNQESALQGRSAFDQTNLPVSFNFFGQFDQGVGSEGPMSVHTNIQGTKSARSSRRHEIDVTGEIRSDQLQLAIQFSNQRFDRVTIEQLAAKYEACLESLIAHCTSVKETVPTPADFTFKGLSISQLAAITENTGSNIHDIYPLTLAQEGMYFHALYDQDKSAYYEQVSYQLQGEINPELVEEAFNKLMSRHEALRAAFIFKGLDQPVQVIFKKQKVEFEFSDLYDADYDPSRLAKVISVYKKSDQERGFELDKDVLMRIHLFKKAASDFELVWSHHHINIDGWSLGLIMTEWFEIYYGLVKSIAPELQTIRKYYKNYMLWAQAQDRATGLQFWSRYLNGYGASLTIPGAKAVVPSKHENRKHQITLPEDLTIQLKQIASENQSSLNTLLQILWGVLLARYNHLNDVVFGAVVSGRPPELEASQHMVGLFINTIPVRINFEVDQTFSQILQQAQDKSLEAAQYHYSALSDIQEASGLHQGLVDHIMVFENFPVEEQLLHVVSGKMKTQADFPFTFTGEMERLEHSNYDFNVIVLPGDALRIKFSYNTLRFEQSSVQRVADQFLYLAEQIAKDPNASASALKLVSPEEEELLNASFSEPQELIPVTSNVIQQFEHQVGLTPAEKAVTYGGQFLTYDVLNRKANQLAHYLMEQDFGPKDKIGVYMRRGPALMISLLGILKTGAAYVPLDPEQEGERLSYMISDADIELMLVQDQLVDRLQLSALDIMILDNGILQNDWLSEYEHDNPEVEVAMDELAYVIYTSGSTGVPKGVMVSHLGLADYLTFAKDFYYDEQLAGSLVGTSHCFDITLPSLYLPLLKGGVVNLLPDEDEIVHLAKGLENSGETNYLLRFTPLHLQAIIDLIGHYEPISAAHVFVVGGAAFSVELYKIAQALFPKATFYNHYGPTEAVVGCAIFNITQELESKHEVQAIPIGTPMANTKLYVMDEGLQPVSVGMAGELCVASEALSLGYLNQPKLSASVFVKDPFGGTVTDHKCYKTGDMVRWLESGNLEFIGRIDDQVKIRGHRVEPGEISHQLKQHTAVKDALVFATTHDQGENELIAAIVSENANLDTHTLERMLSKVLPQYMVPRRYVVLPNLPLNVIGKVDKAAILALESEGTNPEKTIEAPKTEIEEQLLNIWLEVLELKEISTSDNFFELGGHSLKATRMLARIHKEMDMEIPLRSIFENPTIAELGMEIENVTWVEPEEGDAESTEDLMEIDL